MTREPLGATRTTPTRMANYEQYAHLMRELTPPDVSSSRTTKPEVFLIDSDSDDEPSYRDSEVIELLTSDEENVAASSAHPTKEPAQTMKGKSSAPPYPTLAGSWTHYQKSTTSRQKNSSRPSSSGSRVLRQPGQEENFERVRTKEEVPDVVVSYEPEYNHPDLMDVDVEEDSISRHMAFPHEKKDDDFDEDYEYEADSLLGGELELPTQSALKPRAHVDYGRLMNESYEESRSRPLRYQQQTLDEKEKMIKLRKLTAAEKFEEALRSTPAASDMDDALEKQKSKQECEIVFNFARIATQKLEKVNWSEVANVVYRHTNRRRTARQLEAAFECAIGAKRKVRKTVANTSMRQKVSRLGLLGLRQLGRQRALIQDMMLLDTIRTYQLATTFTFASGSIVDMALKTDSGRLKIAIASVATQDIYNRTGNLLLCDLKAGTIANLHGHEHQPLGAPEPMAVTVNDIKLSHSKKFFISASDDHKTMIWNAETGDHLTTIEDCRSRVNRVAICEEPLNGEDLFATCSAEGFINVYRIGDEGQLLAKNRTITTGVKRCVSSLSFGYGHFWDCFAAGIEGQDYSSNVESTSGQVVFYDANVGRAVSVGELGFGVSASTTVSRSVSCLSFSSSGRYLVCGTSGRTTGMDDEVGDGYLRVFDLEKSAKVVQTAYTGHEDVNVVEFSPCENYMISCAHTNEIAVFDRRYIPVNGAPLHRLHHARADEDGSNAGITSVLWWPQGQGTAQSMLMSGGGDGVVRLWDIRRATEDTELWALEGKIGPITRLSSSPAFEHLVLGGDTGAVSVFSVDKGMIHQYETNPMRLFSEEI